MGFIGELHGRIARRCCWVLARWLRNPDGRGACRGHVSVADHAAADVSPVTATAVGIWGRGSWWCRAVGQAGSYGLSRCVRAVLGFVPGAVVGSRRRHSSGAQGAEGGERCCGGCRGSGGLATIAYVGYRPALAVAILHMCFQGFVPNVRGISATRAAGRRCCGWRVERGVMPGRDEPSFGLALGAWRRRQPAPRIRAERAGLSGPVYLVLARTVRNHAARCCG